MSSDQLALVKVTGYHCKKPPTPFMTVGFPLFLPKCPPPGNFLNYINSMEKKKTNKIIIIIWSIFFYLFFFLSPLSHFVLTPPQLTFFYLWPSNLLSSCFLLVSFFLFLFFYFNISVFISFVYFTYCFYGIYLTTLLYIIYIYI